MADLSNPNAGLSPPIPTDLETIFQGGNNFLARMQALADRRDESNAALAKLNLGSDIVGAQKAAQQALLDAQAALADAQNKVSAADDILATAKAQAAKIIADGHDTAKAAVDIANTTVAQIAAASAAAKKEADDYATTTRSSADKVLAQANQTLLDVRDQSATLATAQKNADAALAAAQAAQAEALASKAAHDKRIAKISAIISQPVT